MATGLPDLAELQTEPAQQCSTVSFATLPGGVVVPVQRQRSAHVQGRLHAVRLLLQQVGKDLHGVFVIPKDLPSTIAASMPIFRAENQMGIKSDKEFGKSGLDTQPAYTDVAQAMKTNKSTYARNGLDYKGTVLMRKEAKAQGVTR